RPSLVGRAALPGRHATDDSRAVRSRLLRVKCAFTAGETLDDKASRLIDENRHISLECNHEGTRTRKNPCGLLRAFVSSWLRFYPASCTTFFAASSIESAVVKFILLSRSSRLPSSTFVPSIRITMGAVTPSSLT